MSAVAFRHPEVEENLASSSVASRTPAQAPSHASTSAPTMDWSETAAYVDRFIGAEAEHERARRRRLLRRHKSFATSSSAFLAGALLLVQLVALISLKAAELKVVRSASQLDREIQQTSLQIALNQKKLADYNSLPKLTAWAEQMNYHKATQREMDDVTSNAPLPAPESDEERRR